MYNTKKDYWIFTQQWQMYKEKKLMNKKDKIPNTYWWFVWEIFIVGIFVGVKQQRVGIIDGWQTKVCLHMCIYT